MNARLVPHIGSTLNQRAIMRYRLEQRELEAERALLASRKAPAEVDAFLEWMRQPEPCNFCAPVDDEPTPLWLLTLGAMLWTLLLVIGLGLVAIQRGWLP